LIRKTCALARPGVRRPGPPQGRRPPLTPGPRRRAAAPRLI